MAGYGKENECVVCRETISARDIEYEIAVGAGVAVVSHVGCWRLWRDESAAVLRETA